MCVGLTHFPHGPSGNRREWPLQTLPRHPPFPVGRKRWRKLNLKYFFPFPLYSMCNVHCNGNMMSPSHGAKYSLLNLQWFPRVLSEQNHANTCKQIHTHSGTDKESKFLTALSFHRTAILWGCLHSGRIKAFMVQTISPGGLCAWLCERTCVFPCTCGCVTGGPGTAKGSSWTLSRSGVSRR